MRKDKLVGIALMICSVLVIIIYGWLMFLPPHPVWSLITLKITAFVLIIAVFGILAWIGYTLATTPPPKPIEEIEKEIEQELKKLETELKAEPKSS